MAGPGYLDQRARANARLMPTGTCSSAVPWTSVTGTGGRGERGRIGDGIAFGDLVRPSAHQAANRAPAQVPFRAQPQRRAARQGDHVGGGARLRAMATQAGSAPGRAAAHSAR